MNYFLVSLLFCVSTFFALKAEEKPVILVSVAPYKYFVEKIGGEFLETFLMVPPGASAHTYEPSPKQMIQATKADLWFFLGEPFEKKAKVALQSAKPSMQFVDLRKGIPLLHGSCSHAKLGGSCSDDLHLWLSPRLAKIQAETIKDALISFYPQHKENFESRFNNLAKELDALDAWIVKTLENLPNRTLMVSHPAYGYYCQEYHLTQLPIEFEGRDPTSKQLTRLLDTAKASKVHYILTQPQYSAKAAELIGKEIGAELISVDPYSENYDATLRQITQLIRDHS